MCSAGFPEPYTFSLRARELLRTRRADFDLIHDNQCLGRGLVHMIERDGWPVLATLHHPITVDRDLDMAHTTNPYRKLTLQRWYGFLDMQMKVARRIPRLVTVSESSKRDITAQMGVPADRLHIVPVGVDPEIFGPLPAHRARARPPHDDRQRRRPDEGARAAPRSAREGAHRTRGRAPRRGRPAEGHAAGSPRSSSGSGWTDSVEFVKGVTTERIVELYAEAEVACVPSLYEGFSLPAVEAMACGVPLVATTGGAVPEVVGRHEETGLLVPPGDPSALAAGILRVLGDAELRARIGAAGRERVLRKFTWRQTAVGTVEQYRALLDQQHAVARGGTPC